MIKLFSDIVCGILVLLASFLLLFEMTSVLQNFVTLQPAALVVSQLC